MVVEQVVEVNHMSHEKVKKPSEEEVEEANEKGKVQVLVAVVAEDGGDVDVVEDEGVAEVAVACEEGKGVVGEKDDVVEMVEESSADAVGDNHTVVAAAA